MLLQALDAEELGEDRLLKRSLRATPPASRPSGSRRGGFDLILRAQPLARPGLRSRPPGHGSMIRPVCRVLLGRMVGAYADHRPGCFRGSATLRMGEPMSHRHDPVRVSRRTALGAAAAAGAALGSGRNALAASSDPGGPTTDPYFVTESTETPEANPAPTTPARGTSASPGSTSSRSKSWPITIRFRRPPHGQLGVGSRLRSCSPTEPGSPRWSSTRRTPTPTTPLCASCAIAPRWATPASSPSRR